MPEDEIPEFLTTPEVSAKVRTPIATLRYWRHRGTGPESVRVGRQVLYRRVAVEAWLNQLENSERDSRTR